MARCARSECRRWCPDALARYGRVGVFVNRQWYCSTPCVEETLRRRLHALPPVEPAYVQAWRPMKLGLLIAKQIGLPRDIVDAAIAEQAQAGTPVGRALRNQGLASAEDVLRALATQAGVRYLTTVDPRVVANRPGALPRDIVRALGIVPIAADPERREMQVACTAPVPGLAVRALTKLTEWAVEPLLVTDEVLPELIDVYGAPRHGASADGGLYDRASGPEHVARLAKRRRNVRLFHERCDPYVWVRLDSGGVVSDVLMSMPVAEGGY